MNKILSRLALRKICRYRSDKYTCKFGGRCSGKSKCQIWYDLPYESLKGQTDDQFNRMIDDVIKLMWKHRKGGKI